MPRPERQTELDNNESLDKPFKRADYLYESVFDLNLIDGCGKNVIFEKAVFGEYFENTDFFLSLGFRIVLTHQIHPKYNAYNPK